MKGILIIFVVWGHICSYVSGIYDKNFLTAVIRLYQMPMFILVSGYFQKKGGGSATEFKNQVLKTFKTLVIPYAAWVLIASGADCVSAFLFGGDKVNSLKQIVVTVLDNANILWYLGCLIVFQICYALLSWLSGYLGKKEIWILSLLVLLVLPIDIWYTCFLWPFFLLGRLLNRLGDLEARSKKLKLLPLLIGCVLLTVVSQFYPTSLTFYNHTNFLFEGGVSEILSQLLLVFVRYALYGIVTIVFLLMFFSVYKRFNHSQIVRMVSNIGQRTLAIFVIHIILLFYFFKPLVFLITEGKGFLPNLPGIRFYIVATILTAITVAVCILLSNLIERNFLCARIMLGKRTDHIKNTGN